MTAYLDPASGEISPVGKPGVPPLGLTEAELRKDAAGSTCYLVKSS